MVELRFGHTFGIVCISSCAFKKFLSHDMVCDYNQCFLKAN
jgi:hypothetical protein